MYIYPYVYLYNTNILYYIQLVSEYVRDLGKRSVILIKIPFYLHKKKFLTSNFKEGRGTEIILHGDELTRRHSEFLCFLPQQPGESGKSVCGLNTNEEESA